jgi:hypothetical protein
MTYLCRLSRIFPLLGFALLGLCGTSSGRAQDDVRFSATLTPDQRESAGLTLLSADNVAVIDGLVRQDEAASKFKNNNVDHTRFSQRRTERERAIAGLNRLTPAQLTRLDGLVGLRINGPAPTEPATVVTTAGTAVQSATAGRKLEIHGELGFTYGWGKGGNVSGSDLILTYDDPAGRYSVLVGYAEYRGKGLVPCYYPGNGFYRPYPSVVPISR